MSLCSALVCSTQIKLWSSYSPLAFPKLPFTVFLLADPDLPAFRLDRVYTLWVCESTTRLCITVDSLMMEC